MAKSPRIPTQHAVLRQGEGHAIDINLQPVIMPNGETQFGFNVNLMNAQVPTRRYLADIATVVKKKSGMNLIFAQEQISSNELRSLLAVHLSSMGIRNFIGSFNNLPLEEIMKSSGCSPQDLTPIEREPAQAIAFSANFFASATSGDEACIDCYNVSPFSMHTAPSIKKINAEPVVRIELSLPVLYSVVNEARLIANELSADNEVSDV